MKVVYFAHSVLNRGGDKMVLAHLSHLAASGHDVTIMTNEKDTIFSFHPSITVSRLSLPGKIGSILSALLTKRDADVVIASIVAMAVLLSFRNRGRVVLFAQDDNESVYRNGFGRYLVRLLYHIHFGIFRAATIAVSEHLSVLFSTRFGASVPAIPNGIDLNVFYPDPDETLVRGKNGGKAVLIFSRPDSRKGFDLSVKVLNRLAGRLEHSLELWTVGEPVENGAVSVPVRNFGYVTEGCLRRIMSSADVFLYPSRSEGFGLMVMEAFACRCPVVTTDAVPFASDGDNSLVSPIGDDELLAENVARLMCTPKLASTLAGHGYAVARDHNLSDSSQMFEDFLSHFTSHTGKGLP